MANFTQDLQEFINAQVWAPGFIEFDAAPDFSGDENYIMIPVDDPGERSFMCSLDSGQAVIEFNGYARDRYTLYSKMVDLRVAIRYQVRGKLPNYDLWFVRCTGVSGFGTEEQNVYRYTFEMTTRWEVNP